MTKRDIRKGITQQEISKEMFTFIAFECLIITCLATYGGVVYFGFNGILTFLISMVVTIGIIFTPLYPAFGLLFSFGWAFIGYKFFYWLITILGGGKGTALTTAIIGFILFFLLTILTRLQGREYVEDMQD